MGNRVLIRARGVLLCAALLAAVASAPARAALEVPPPKIDVGAFLLMDFETGQVVAEKNADARLPPASLAKIMTSFIVFRALDEGRLRREREIEISTKAWKTGGSRMFIEPQTPVAIGDLLRGLVVQSGNDAAVALAEAFAGDEESFVDVMNQQSRELGLENTQWGSASGLPRKSQWASARDMAVLTREMIARYPVDYRLYAEKEFTYNGITQKNRNRLLETYPGADGVKTGHTKAAGYALAASAAGDGGRRWIAVVMKAKSPRARARACARLLDYGFSHFETAAFFDRDKTRAIPVWGGDADSVRTRVLADSGKMTLPRGTKWETKIEIESPLWAPIEEGRAIGSLRALDDAGEVLAEYPLVATESVAAGGWGAKMIDKLKVEYLGHAESDGISEW